MKSIYNLFQYDGCSYGGNTCMLLPVDKRVPMVCAKVNWECMAVVGWRNVKRSIRGSLS
jgi:hypothetical protein